jgi:hypothetical protein
MFGDREIRWIGRPWAHAFGEPAIIHSIRKQTNVAALATIWFFVVLETKSLSRRTIRPGLRSGP